MKENQPKLYVWRCEACGYETKRPAARGKDGSPPKSCKCPKCKSEALTVVGF